MSSDSVSGGVTEYWIVAWPVVHGALVGAFDSVGVVGLLGGSSWVCRVSLGVGPGSGDELKFFASLVGMTRWGIPTRN